MSLLVSGLFMNIFLALWKTISNTLFSIIQKYFVWYQHHSLNFYLQTFKQINVMAKKGIKTSTEY